MKDMYQKLAYDYDEFGRIEDYSKEERSFLEGMLRGISGKKVLDCACGTGQRLLMLSQAGFQMYGSDYSESMLVTAKQNLSKYNLDLPLKQCDFRFLEKAFDESFDAVLCMNNSLPHFQEDADLICALKSMKSRLRDGGFLILTSGTTEATLKLPPIEVVVNREDFSRMFVKKYDGRLQTIDIVDLYHSKERLESNQYQVVYRALLEHDYRRLLAEAGFSKIDIYGDFKGTPYNKDSWKIIIAAS